MRPIHVSCTVAARTTWASRSIGPSANAIWRGRNSNYAFFTLLCQSAEAVQKQRGADLQCGHALPLGHNCAGCVNGLHGIRPRQLALHVLTEVYSPLVDWAQYMCGERPVHV